MNSVGVWAVKIFLKIKRLQRYQRIDKKANPVKEIINANARNPNAKKNTVSVTTQGVNAGYIVNARSVKIEKLNKRINFKKTNELLLLPSRFCIKITISTNFIQK